MFSTVRDVLSRFFGSDEVEMTFITPTPTTAPVSPAEAQAAALPAVAPASQAEVVERRALAPVALRTASQAK